MIDKEHLFQGKMQNWNWPDELKESIVDLINITQSTENMECQDNFRVARAGNENEVAEYMHRREHGCCGYYDNVVFLEIDDKTIPVMYGFNYGH